MAGSREPRIIGQPTFDQHHGITLMIAYDALKGNQVDSISISTRQAMELAERLTRCARQSLPAVND